MAETNPHRLPRTVLPRRYDLRLAPDLEAATFAGTVAIEVEVQAPTREVAWVPVRAGVVALLTGYSPAASRWTDPTKASPRAP